MDPRFTRKVIEELQRLLYEAENGLPPTNPNLDAAVTTVIRLQNPDL